MRCPSRSRSAASRDPGRARRGGGPRRRYIGLVFYPPSPRALDLSRAAELACAVPDRPSDRRPLRRAGRAPIDGRAALRPARRPPAPRRRDAGARPRDPRCGPAAGHEGAARRGPTDLGRLDDYADAADLLLLRRQAATSHGRAAGRQWPAVRLAAARGLRPRQPWALAGGLNPDNLAAAVGRLARRPSSTSAPASRARPGVKDPDGSRRSCATAARLTAQPVTR